VCVSECVCVCDTQCDTLQTSDTHAGLAVYVCVTHFEV
jgi:hypothetical protein